MQKNSMKCFIFGLCNPREAGRTQSATGFCASFAGMLSEEAAIISRLSLATHLPASELLLTLWGMLKAM